MGNFIAIASTALAIAAANHRPVIIYRAVPHHHAAARHETVRPTPQVAVTSRETTPREPTVTQVPQAQ